MLKISTENNKRILANKRVEREGEREKAHNQKKEKIVRKNKDKNNRKKLQR